MNHFTLILSIWFIVSLILGYSGLLGKISPPFHQIILLCIVITLIISFFRFKNFKKWTLSLSLRTLISVHIIRFIGFYFLFLYSKGQLPYEFAVPAGIGDIVIAISALYIISNYTAERGVRITAVLIWNLFGLADIMFVIFTAARLMFSAPDSMIALTELPLSTLITFFVPLIIYSHLVIFYVINRSRRSKVYE